MEYSQKQGELSSNCDSFSRVDLKIIYPIFFKERKCLELKKMLLLLLLSFLMVGSGKDIYASSLGGGGASFAYDYNCGYCKGDYMNYYSTTIESPYVWCAVSHVINNNTLVSCNHLSYGLSASDDKFYTIKMIRDDGLYYAYIRLSSDDTFEFYKADGTVTTKPLSDFTSSNYGGVSNGLYFGYWIYLASWNPYYIDYEKPCNYQIVATSYSDGENKMQKLVKFLSGELTELSDGITEVAPLPIYDLEPPLDIKINTGSASVNVESDSYTNIKSGTATLIPHKIWWSQSNIDLTGYETEFYIKEYGRCRKSIFSTWQDCNTGWLFDGSHVTAKYCNNNLKWHEFRCWESTSLNEVAIIQLEDDNPKVEFNSCDFMIRNKKEDEDGQIHYSNWIYVNTYEDGTYSVFEMVQDYDITEDSDETGNIDTDSTIYDDEVIYEDTNTTVDVGGISNTGSFLTVLKDLANSIKTFPDFFAQMFSFLPNWILTSIGTLFIIILICAIF